ncbi:MAG: class I SAM-dependent methyltransferase [Chloroflexi bacterium]|nr:class I SAM-dependent methyltransferase [Chloroflexota bacterium]
MWLTSAIREWINRYASVGEHNYRADYLRLVRNLKRTYPLVQAMHKAVGGDFRAIGLLEYYLLAHHGLKPNDYLIDVGCGSGRLSHVLAPIHKGRYMGTDVVPDLVDYARRTVHRPDWSFKAVKGLSIPEQDAQADMICFFSVFTHLLHEQSYLYLQDARRALKVGGRIIFSFLDFGVLSHWGTFEATVKHGSPHLNMFIAPDDIPVWARHLGLKVESIHRGDAPYIPLPAPIVHEDGSTTHSPACFGQSVCVLVKTEL